MAKLTRRELIAALARAPLVAPVLAWAPGCLGTERNPSSTGGDCAEDGSACAWTDGADRFLRADGLPRHETGVFPNPGCPFPIGPQRYLFRVDAVPRQLPASTATGMWVFGVALNGVPLDPAGPYLEGDASTGWQFEVTSHRARMHLGLDGHEAHVQPGGGYHYHGKPEGLYALLGGTARSRMTLVGWAADGFPIYGPASPGRALDPESPVRLLQSSYQLRAGRRSGGPGGSYDGTFVEDYSFVEGSGDLDECNGRFGPTPEFPEGIYHYHLTDSFPFIPRRYRGQPDRGFEHMDPGLEGVPPALRGFRG